jgi:hypothetical protein
LIVAVRESTAELRATPYVTLVLPWPLAGATFVTHSALLAAVHAQDAGAVRSIVPLPASFENEADAGDIVTMHRSVPSWLTATGCPATVSVPTRASPFAFAVTVTATLPDPVPLAPLPMVIHPRSDAAVHAHEGPVVTLTDEVPPEAPNASDDGESVKVQDAGGGEGPSGDVP